MKKILMIASEASHFKNFHIPYIKYLLDNDIEVFTASRGVFSFEGVKHIEIPYKKKLFCLANVGIILKLASIIRKSRFDTVFTNSTLAGFTGRAAALLCSRKTKVVHISHGYLFNDDKSFRSRIYLYFEKLVKNRTDILAVMNDEDYQIAQKYRLSKHIVFINGMGLDTKNFPPVSNEEIQSFKKENGIDENKFLFLCVGEFTERKHQQTIIEACSLIKNDNFVVVFAGEGNKLDFCKDLVHNNKVQDRTLFLGHCSNVNLLYRSCDCLISSSEYEGLPFNVMEGLYCGKNALLTNVKGNKDLAALHGLKTYNYSDYKELSRLMSDLIENHSQNKDKKTQSENTVSLLNPKYLIDNTLNENLKLFGITKTQSGNDLSEGFKG